MAKKGIVDGLKSGVEKIDGGAAAFNQMSISQGKAKETKKPEKKATSTSKTAEEIEKLERAENFKTSGHKGEKLPRINMAFTPSNYKFITTIGKLKSGSATKFVNEIVKEYMENNKQQILKELLEEE